MPPPRVSIGLPVYNGERYLSQALESLLGQTFADFELILSDNASTDGTREIGESYAARDERVRYSRTEANLGAARNFNRAFQLSSAVYFKWAAADDLCEPAYLARCVEALDRHPEVVLCYPQTRIIDASGRFLKDYDDGFDLRALRPHERFRAFFQAPGLCNPVFGLMRSEVLGKTGLIGGYASSDRVLLGELTLHGAFYEHPERLFLRRTHPEKSTAANPTEVQFAAWFDPKLRGKRLLPRWRRLWEYVQAIRRAPLTRGERLRCYRVLGQFAFVPKRWAGMLGDVARATGLVRSP